MPLVIHGHRGSRGTHPENTIASFAEAWASGAPFVELDVHLTRDRELIVFHDKQVSARLCRDRDGKPLATPIAIAELTLEDIRSFDVGSQALSAFPEQELAPAKIPTLEELILWKKGHAPGLKLNVEIKAGSASPDLLAHATVTLLAKHGLIGESLIQSFDFDIVRAARRAEPDVRLSCLFERPADFAKQAHDCQAQVVAAHYLLLDENTVGECQEAKLEVLPWTVNHSSEWERLIELGIEAIITDYPRKLAAFVAEQVDG